jgi:Helix-turn-helix domain
MARPIIAAIRQRTDLKESLLHTAQELAHRASIYGVVRVSYSYLALKCHCSRRTVIRHIQRLIDAGILRKSVLWICGHYCEVNTYAFLLSWEKRPARQGSDIMAPKSPQTREREEKYGSMAEKKRLDAKGLAFLTPGSALYRLVVAHQGPTEGGEGPLATRRW